jgi:putative SOS response-associated peptidase YedK
MPVILPETCHGIWLGEEAGGADLKAILCPLDAGLMEAWEVSPLVNSPRNNGPQLVEHYAGTQAPARAVNARDSA